jgi:hypothetical protein
VESRRPRNLQVIVLGRLFAPTVRAAAYVAHEIVLRFPRHIEKTA